MHNISALRRLGLVLVCLYLISGAASLAYEILWTRMLSLQFGVSIFGVVVTVAAYMAGLGVGSFLGARWSRLTSRPLRLFAFIELFVAVTALTMPALFQAVDTQFAIIAGNTSYFSWIALQIFIVTLVLMIPAMAMGAGFPLILSAVQGAKVSLGSIYGINALGGALGALLPLWLLPVLGWLSSLRAVALVSLVVAGVLFLLSWRFESAQKREVTNPLIRPSIKWLLVYAGIGVGALLLQIGWARLFGMVMLRTEYVLAIILAVFLSGIGFGSLLARLLTKKYWFSVLPVVACGFALLSLWWLPVLSSWVERAHFSSLFAALWLQGLAIVILTLPVTLVLGAWLPLLAERVGNRYQSGVWLYGANSLGAALGALLAGFVFIPSIGSSSTIVLGAMLLLIFGLVLAQGWASRPAWALVIVMGALSMMVMEMPPVSRLLPQAYAETKTLSLHEDAISITHVVVGRDGQRQLLADMRRMDASSDPTAIEVQKNQVRLPLLLHPEPQRVLFLGLGTGISASASLGFPGLQRTAVELSLGAINAAREEFRPVNGGITDHLKIVRDDARHFLLSDAEYYDVIIGDLFHPDLVGRSALLSRQQFMRAHKRLSSGGIFVQWLALNQFDINSLQVVLASFKDVFPNAVIFVDAFRLAMVGVRDGSISGAQLLSNVQRLTSEQVEVATGSEGSWTWLGRYWGGIPEFDVPRQDEWAPVIEYQLPEARYDGSLDISKVLSWLLSIRRPLDGAVSDLRISENDFPLFERAYIATELAHRSWLALLHGNAIENQRLLPLAYRANPKDRWVGFALADAVLQGRAAAQARGLSEQQLLESVLRIRPDHTEALRRLWELAELAGNSEQAAVYRQRFAVLSPLNSALQKPYMFSR
ncbi:MAG: fused MFS/spermidine synthase [Gammaproteobacteria bacterium]|nr:fused MFS/spermidine synthase [Gammaproteobacteria bacterium]